MALARYAVRKRNSLVLSVRKRNSLALSNRSELIVSRSKPTGGPFHAVRLVVLWTTREGGAVKEDAPMLSPSHNPGWGRGRGGGGPAATHTWHASPLHPMQVGNPACSEVIQ